MHVCGKRAISAASATAASRAVPGATTRLASPIASASSAPTARPGEDQVERARVADQAGEAHGAAVDQRHAPAAAEHAERSRRSPSPAGRTTARAPARRRPRSPRPRRSPASASSMRVGPIGPSPSVLTELARSVPNAFRSAPAQNVPCAPVRTATCWRGVGLEGAERVGERGRGRTVDGVARLRPVDRDDGDRVDRLDRDGHDGLRRVPAADEVRELVDAADGAGARTRRAHAADRRVARDRTRGGGRCRAAPRGTR